MDSLKLLIVFHSQSGRNAALAKAVRDGVRVAAQEIETELLLRYKRAWEADSADLMWCDALVLVTPENFGYLSGAMKDFFDRSFYALEPLQRNLPYALVVGCGNDGSGAVRQLERIARGYPFKAVAEPLIVHGVPDKNALRQAFELGQSVALGSAMGIF